MATTRPTIFTDCPGRRPAPGATTTGLMTLLVAATFLVAAVLCGPLSALAQGDDFHSKLAQPSLAVQAADDDTFVRVIVLLEGHQVLSGVRLNGSQTLIGTLRRVVRDSREELLAGTDPNHVRVESSFDLIPAFSARVNRSGLAALAASGAVASIQTNPELRLFTTQGAALMSAADYRQSHGGAGVSIAVVDSGVDYSHPALGDGGFPNSKIIGGYDFGDDDADPMDDSADAASRGHGTACAAIAAGQTLEDGVGPADYSGGVAPQAKLYALKIVDTAGAITMADAYRAWEWALAHKNDDPENPILVVSNSWGSDNFYTSYCDSDDPTGTGLLTSLEANGITVIQASGNDGMCDSLTAPACLSGSLSVGAVYDAEMAAARSYAVKDNSCVGAFLEEFGVVGCTDSQGTADQVACYSNSGPVLDIVAPADCASVPFSDGGYTECFNGTSAATAYAAGAAAVVQSWAKSLGTPLAPVDLKGRLIDHGDCVADPKSGLSRVRLNIAQAIAGAGGGGCSPASNIEEITVVEAQLTLTEGQETSFVIAVPQGALTMTAVLTGVSGNPDLYSKFGQLPTMDDNDCASIQAEGSDESCVHDVPTPGSWYVTVRGVSPATATLKVTYTRPRQSEGTAQWGVINYACCLAGGEFSYSGTVEGVTMTSTTQSCQASPGWEGFATTTAGSKSYGWSRNGCENSGQGSINLTLEAGKCYYVALDYQNGEFAQTLYTADSCARPAVAGGLAVLPADAKLVGKLQ